MTSTVESTLDVARTAENAVIEGFFGLPVSTAEAIFLSAAVAAIFSAIAIYGNWAIARKRATIDHISAIMWDDHYIGALKTFVKYRKNRKNLIDLINSDSDDKIENKSKVISVFNENELVALGIKRRIMDEKIYREWRGTAFVRDWSDAEIVITQLRGEDGKTKAFIQFEWLANKWKKKGL